LTNAAPAMPPTRSKTRASATRFMEATHFSGQ
jgi:hypothetical protein